MPSARPAGAVADGWVITHRRGVLPRRGNRHHFERVKELVAFTIRPRHDHPCVDAVETAVDLLEPGSLVARKARVFLAAISVTSSADTLVI